MREVLCFAIVRSRVSQLSQENPEIRKSLDLEADLPSPGKNWAQADSAEGAGVGLPHGGGEPDLRSAPLSQGDFRIT